MEELANANATLIVKTFSAYRGDDLCKSFKA